MNIAFAGNGKLARVTMSFAQERSHHVATVYDSARPVLLPMPAKGVDLFFEMSRPELVVPHVLAALEAGLPVVIGTTGWYERMHEIKQYCNQLKGSVLWASNFAPGVQIFRRLARSMAVVLDALPEFRMELHESHHLQKLDSPSGTAVHTAGDILSGSGRLQRWVHRPSTDPAELPVISHRLEGELGTHTVWAQSEFEGISLEHRANDRRAFGVGAVLAAEWLLQHRGFFSIDDFYESLWSSIQGKRSV
jgi:4-hydroxy-tetrahydrodipicolinate reductase